MRSLLWFLAALTTWWSISTVNCGDASCLGYIIFFYSAFWLPVMVYLAGAEALARALSDRRRALRYMRAPMYVGLAAAGFAGLFGLMQERIGGPAPPGMILVPSVAVAIIYLIRSLNLIGILWNLIGISWPLLLRGLA
jgi:hypothetical protein